MIDLFTLALTHSLIALALWRMLFRADLDADGAAARSPRRPGKPKRGKESGERA